jgi:hypothetical protein
MAHIISLFLWIAYGAFAFIVGAMAGRWHERSSGLMTCIGLGVFFVVGFFIGIVVSTLGDQ